MQVDIEPAALEDIRSAARWYDEKEPGAGNRFIEAFDEVFHLIGERPRSFPIYARAIRRAQLRRFPYGVFFARLPGRIAILAVIHLQRDPNYIRDRIN